MNKLKVFSISFVLLLAFGSCVNGSDNVTSGDTKGIEKNKEVAQANVTPQIEESISEPEGEEIVVGNEVGNDLGDFMAYGPDSTIHKLSDMRGKLTLLVLWNSKCGHCVIENQKYATAYETYRDKQFVNGDGFDVYSIALDKLQTEWLEHLGELNYPWETNVYVIDSWKDADIRFFGIKNLPGTFLIDENGIVVAKKFTGTELPSLLEGYLKK